MIRLLILVHHLIIYSDAKCSLIKVNYNKIKLSHFLDNNEMHNSFIYDSSLESHCHKIEDYSYMIKIRERQIKENIR